MDSNIAASSMRGGCRRGCLFHFIIGGSGPSRPYYVLDRRQRGDKLNSKYRRCISHGNWRSE